MAWASTSCSNELRTTTPARCVSTSSGGATPPMAKYRNHTSATVIPDSSKAAFIELPSAGVVMAAPVGLHDFLCDRGQLPVRMLGGAAQHVECLLGGAAVPLHEDALGLADEIPALQ